LIAPRAGVRVWIATRPIDFRRGVHGLTALVAQVLPIDPYGGVKAHPSGPMAWIPPKAAH
jgi:transposase